MRSIEKARDVEAHHFLYALSIPLCGQDVCKRLLSAYSLQDIITIASGKSENIVPASDSPFSLIAGIGPEKSNQVVTWFHDEENLAMVEELLQQVRVSQENTAAEGDSCKGLTFVVTGDVTHYKNRNELKAYIESQGGKVTGSVSKSTDYLINNDVASQSSKNQKAQQLGIPIISEEEFIEKFGKE